MSLHCKKNWDIKLSKIFPSVYFDWQNNRELLENMKLDKRGEVVSLWSESFFGELDINRRLRKKGIRINGKNGLTSIAVRTIYSGNKVKLCLLQDENLLLSKNQLLYTSRSGRKYSQSSCKLC